MKKRTTKTPLVIKIGLIQWGGGSPNAKHSNFNYITLQAFEIITILVTLLLNHFNHLMCVYGDIYWRVCIFSV